MEESEYRYILVTDILYPKELLDKHNDLPFFPEKRTVKEEELSPFQKELLGNMKFKTSEKFMATLYDKKKYTVHEKYLKLGLDHGLVMADILNVIRFNQSNFLNHTLIARRGKEPKQRMNLRRIFLN